MVKCKYCGSEPIINTHYVLNRDGSKEIYYFVAQCNVCGVQSRRVRYIEQEEAVEIAFQKACDNWDRSNRHEA